MIEAGAVARATAFGITNNLEIAMSKDGLKKRPYAVLDTHKEMRKIEMFKNHLWIVFSLPDCEQSTGHAFPLSYEDFADMIYDFVEDLSEKLGLSQDLVWRTIDVWRFNQALGGGHG